MKYVIIGNSAAGIGAVEGIRQIDKQGEITIITDEKHHTYSRPLISYHLLGVADEEKMKYRPDNFYNENNCTLLSDVTAVEFNVKTKQVILANGKTVPYDKLLVATGSSAFIPPFEGVDTVKKQFTFMGLDEAQRLGKSIDENTRVLIIGAGLIGLKCAEGIFSRVSRITVIDLAPRILSSILDEDGAKIVQTHIESRGINFRLGASVKSFDGKTALLANGEKIEFDVLVLAVGVRPNTSLLKGIANIEKGIVIDSKSQTSAADIYAAGDCTQSTDISSGQSKIMALLPNAYMQGECAGVTMAGGETIFENAIPMTAIGFFGLHIITAGNYSGEEYYKNGDGNYKRLFFSDNKLNGFIIIGDVEKAGIYTSLVRERTPLDTIDFALVCEKPGLMAFTKEDRLLKLGSESK
jgi:NAD(P)H-nitrite reductase large subunit